MGRNWELANEAYEREPQLGQNMAQWFSAGWAAARKRFPGTMEKSVEACDAEYQRYLTVNKAGTNTEWGPRDWFTQGYWRFQSWVNRKLEEAYSEPEVER